LRKRTKKLLLMGSCATTHNAGRRALGTLEWVTGRLL
jgi:hypothetical protein